MPPAGWRRGGRRHAAVLYHGMPRPLSATVLTTALAVLAGTAPHAAPQPPVRAWAGAPGARVLLDAHNCYPDEGRWADRIDRALATGLPLAIEQDLVWFRDPRSGVSRSIVAHGEPFSGTEPSLATHFFERIRPIIEQALRDGRRETWPIIVLNLDLKSNEPEHHAAIWETLGTYEPWLTTAERVADASRPMPLDVKPVLVLTGNPDAQQAAFHDRVPVGGRLRVFGAIPMDLEAKVGKGKEAIPKLAGLTPAELIASGATNYRRWVNFPWAVVERGGQTEAGAWTPADAARLAALSALAHSRGLWIRFYTLNGHAAAGDRGWTASYNFGSPAAVETRWRAARDAGVDFIATDQYEGLARILARPAAASATPPQTPPAAAATQRPGVQGHGVTLLPNGWRISPAGRHLQAGDFPLAMTATPDRRYLVITNNGFSTPTLTVIDTERWAIKARVPVEHAWLGLAWDAAGTRLYSAGAAENTVHVFDYAAGALKQGTPLVVAPSALKLPPGTTDMAGTGFVGGIATAVDGKTLFAVHVFGRAISAIDLASGTVRTTVSLPAEPYTAVPASDGRRVFVSLWGGARVLALDAATLAPMGEVTVGDHPNAMVLSKDGQRLFVACANTNKVWVIDTATLAAREQIGVSPFPEAPAGTTPNALSVSPDGRTLAVANADNNTIAMIDIAQPGRSEVAGFIPTGWYPTAVLFDHTGRKLFVLSGKGLIGQANPRGPNVSPMNNGQYAGELLQGTVSVVDVPDAAHLAADTARVIELSAYSDARRLTPAGAPAASPIPRRVGDASPIKHVFYVIRENRTYDQVLGDLEPGNGDPTLAIFGEDVTPNAHALARQFVLLDNFYVDAEVSYDGHAFSTGAYATDVVEKLWPTNYGHRGGVYLSEGGYGDRNPYGNLSAPSDGYIWDFATRAGVSVRSYGEFADWAGTNANGTRRVEASVPGLKGLVHPAYPPYDLSIPDAKRIEVWLEEFRRFEANGELPRLNIIRLGNDHTFGTRPGMPTPRAMVAENDQALGRLVETISHSRVWNESAIFVLEDDAQNGPDHVDSHRSPAFVISPFTQRGIVDSTLYTTSGMLRTMELILGLRPMSQYDAAATPMYNAFQTTAAATPYTALPARVPLDERNAANAWGAGASLAMNFVEADRTPEFELNEIVWKSVRGADSPMPPPVRAGFIKVIDDDDDEDDDKPAGKPTAKPTAQPAAKPGAKPRR